MPTTSQVFAPQTVNTGSVMKQPQNKLIFLQRTIQERDGNTYGLTLVRYV